MVANLLNKFFEGVSLLVFENKYNNRFYKKLVNKGVKLIKFKDNDGKVIIKKDS